MPMLILRLRSYQILIHVVMYIIQAVYSVEPSRRGETIANFGYFLVEKNESKGFLII